MIETVDVELLDLLVAVGRGDAAAFKTLYTKTSATLFGIILRIARNRGRAEEVMQDVYLRIWLNARTFVPETGTAMGWMTTIARHRAIDVLREKPLVTTESDEGSHALDSMSTFDDRESALTDAMALRRCLDGLAEPARSCIVLAYCEGLSRDELARRFERPVNTIKTWLHRNLAALKSCLETPA